MDHYVGSQIIDQLRELNQNIKDLVEATQIKTTELSYEPEEQIVNPNAADQPLAEWEKLLTSGEVEGPEPTFEQDLVHLLNKHGMEKYSNTPDWVLAQFLVGCLKHFDVGVVLQNRSKDEMQKIWNALKTETPKDN